MKTTTIGSGLALLLALVSNPSHAETLASHEDIRCVAAILVETLSIKQEKGRLALLSAGEFFLGRLNGREPELEFEPLILVEMKKMHQDEVPAELDRCDAQIRSENGWFKKLEEDLASLDKEK